MISRPRSRGIMVSIGGAVVFSALAAIILIWSRHPGASPGSTVAPSGNQPESVQQAPDIRVSTIDGQAFALSEQKGHPVVVFFSASWCSSCVPEVEKLAKLQAAYADRGLKVLFLSVDPTDNTADWERFRRNAHGPQDYWALDVGQRATLAYGVRATDTKVFIDRNGRIVSQYAGPMPYGVYESEVERSL